MHLSRKARVACGIGIAAVIIAGAVVMSSSRSATPRCHPKLIERYDDSFELVEVKTKHYWEIGYRFEHTFRGKILVTRDRVLAALRLQKRQPVFYGPSDVVCITFRAKNLNASPGIIAGISGSNGTPEWTAPFVWRYDKKTTTGVAEVLLPNTPTNLAGWKLALRVLVGWQFNGYKTYAEFSL